MATPENQSGSESENEFLAELQAGFLQEAADLIASVEGSFLALEKDPSDTKEMEQILRLFHNLKGSAAAVSFSQLSELCHKVENLLVKVREKELTLTSELVSLLLECTDQVNQAIATLAKNLLAHLDFSKPIRKIEEILSHIGDPPTPPPKLSEAETKRLLESIPEALVLADAQNIEAITSLLGQIQILQKGLGLDKGPLKTHLQTAITHLEKVLARVDPGEEFQAATAILTQCLAPEAPPSFQADPELDPKLLQDFLADAHEQLEAIDSNLLLLEKEPTSSDSVDSVFRGFHTLKSASAIIHVGAIEMLAHALESALDTIREKKDATASPEIISLCLEGTSVLRQLVDLTARGEAVPEALANARQALLTRISALGQPEAKSMAAPEAQTTTSVQATAAQCAAVREPIKVDADRLDRLVDSIGELVIAEAMVAQSQDLKQIQAASVLFKHMDRLNKITRNLQEIGMALRMVPIRQTFRKMTRIVRDLSKKMDKDIDFQMSGEDTELDRTVAEKIGDPLVHMVRNAIDHGIEKTREDRIKTGKSPVGRVELRALQKAGSIWLEIEDDGRGLNKDVLIKKAREKGLIDPNQTLSDQEAYQLIFAPGFSTAEKVTDVSGRGVGMDVVRKNIEELHGQVDIETTLGKGTLFRIRIPNTLAIIEGMVVRIGAERYVIPTQSILMAIQPEPKNLIKSAGAKRELLDLHGEILPFFRLGQLYNIKGSVDDPLKGIVLIVEDNQKRLGLLVDQILNQQQFVMKNLGEMMKGVPGVSGGTIMPDGQVGLILDVGLLVQGLLTQKHDVKAQGAHTSKPK